MTLTRFKLLSRRRVLAGSLAAGASLVVPYTAQAKTDETAVDPTGEAIFYFPETGHHISGAYALSWEHMGGLAALGPPISEPTGTWNIEYQAFKNGILSRALVDPYIRGAFGPARPLGLGQDLAAKRPASLDSAAGDATSAFWFRWTERGVHPRLWRAFLEGGGAHAFGYPISNLVDEDGLLVQWFERARLQVVPWGSTERIVPTPLGVMAAPKLGLDLNPVPQRPNARIFDGAIRPLPKGPIEERRIDVDLNRQHVFAYQGDELVFEAVTSTGLPQYHTPIGEFKIFRRVADERMIGGTTGADYYDLSDVYYTQYFTARGDALHYAYWHDNFGQEMSHGCVNLTLADSKWFWDFSDNGVPVKTHDSSRR